MNEEKYTRNPVKKSPKSREKKDEGRTAEKKHGSKLKNETSANKSYREKLRYGKKDNSLTVDEAKKLHKMELIIQKAVELGAYQIIPVATKRAIVKLDAKKEASKLKRWQAIAEGAAKQSGRMLIPQISEVKTYGEALQMAQQLDINVIPYECARGMDGTREIFGNIKPGMSVGIFIGPEGGFEESEVEKAESLGVKPVTLGKRILRTETAGLTTLSILMYLLEES